MPAAACPIITYVAGGCTYCQLYCQLRSSLSRFLSLLARYLLSYYIDSFSFLIRMEYGATDGACRPLRVNVIGGMQVDAWQCLYRQALPPFAFSPSLHILSDSWPSLFLSVYIFIYARSKHA